MKRDLIGLFAVVCLGVSAACAAPSTKPNFIIIFTDDQGYQDLGCYGSPDIKTPRIDQMAGEGMRFTNFYAQTVCGPSRAALMTGCYPLRLARQSDPDSIHPELHIDEITIAEVLKAQGYATAAFGKWDLAGHNQTGYKPKLLPSHQGFDYYFGTPSSNDRSVNLMRNTEMVEKKADMSTLTRRYTDEAIAFIEKNTRSAGSGCEATPFFVYLAHTMPHTRLAASKEFKGSSAGGLYGDVIEELDYHVGRLLDKVKELKLDDNTYIIFTSDNGPWHLRGDHGGHANPLRGAKTSCWEGGLRVPCIMRAPGRIPAGTECDALVATIDLMPTLVGLVGGAVPSDRAVDGIDISKVMHGRSDTLERSYFYYQHDCLRAVRSGRWKLMLPHTEPVQGSIATMWKNHIAKADAIRIQKSMLFDLDADIGETTNVADRYPGKAAELMKLAEWAQHDIGDHDRFGANARTFGAQRRTLSGEAKVVQTETAPEKRSNPVEENVKSSPNVVLIFADDLGYGDLGCYGATKVRTPNIDRLAEQGRRFTDAHTASAVCTPSRYALLTGEYPLRGNGGKGVWGPAPVTSGLIIETDKLTIADVFKRKGYATAVLGKWHLGFGDGKNNWREPLRPGPQDLGFDYYFGIPVVNSAPPYVYVENDRIVGGDPADPLVYIGRNAKGATPITPIPPEASQRTANMFKGAVEAHKKYNDYTVGTVLAKKAVDWITANRRKPFFLYLATTHIHHPFTPGKRFQGTSDAELYGDFIQELDWMVGQVTQCLERHGLNDNTLVIFTSDNGAMMNLGGRNAVKAGHKINGDLLGFKFGVWEGGHRVPFIAKWPGKIEAGTRSHQLICNVDMLATFMALTGQNPGILQGKDSVNVLPALLGNPEEPIRKELLLAARSQRHLSIRKGKWMYIPARGSGGFRGSKPHQHAWGGPAAVALVGGVNSDFENGKFKKNAPSAQLYDLEADVNQTKNLYNEYPEVVREMEALLTTYRQQRQSAGNRRKNRRNNQ